MRVSQAPRRSGEAWVLPPVRVGGGEVMNRHRVVDLPPRGAVPKRWLAVVVHVEVLTAEVFRCAGPAARE